MFTGPKFRCYILRALLYIFYQKDEKKEKSRVIIFLDKVKYINTNKKYDYFIRSHHPRLNPHIFHQKILRL